MIDWNILNFWLSKTDYIQTLWNQPIHQKLLEKNRDSDGKPVPTLVVLAGGEQSGKSSTGGNHCYAVAATPPQSLVWIVGERYHDCHQDFEYMVESGIKTGVLRREDVNMPQEGQWTATFRKSGTVVKTLSSGDVTTLHQEAPDGIMMVEAGRQTRQAFDTLWVRATHKRAWFLVSGTFEEAKGRWYPDLFKECLSDNKYAGVSLSLPTYANPILYPEGPNDPKILALRKTLSEEQFAERILGQPRPSLGVVFPEFRRSVHVKESAEYDPGYPVVLWVDPGFFPSSYAVLWTQIVGEQVRIFNEFYLQLTVTDDVLTLVENHPQFPKVERIVIDIAAEAHAGAMDPAASAWRVRFTHRGRNIPVVSRYVKEEVGRARIHDKLRVSPNTGSPGLILHPRCENSIYEFEDGYKFHVRSSTREIGSDKPQDRNNHSIKAIAYGLVDKYGAFEGNVSVLPQSYRRVMAYDRVLR